MVDVSIRGYAPAHAANDDSWLNYNSPTDTVTPPAGTTTGDMMLLVAIGVRTNTSPGSTAINRSGSGWTLLWSESLAADTFATMEVRVWWKAPGPSEGPVTVTYGSAYLADRTMTWRPPGSIPGSSYTVPSPETVFRRGKATQMLVYQGSAVALGPQGFTAAKSTTAVPYLDVPDFSPPGRAFEVLLMFAPNLLDAHLRDTGPQSPSGDPGLWDATPTAGWNGGVVSHITGRPALEFQDTRIAYIAVFGRSEVWPAGVNPLLISPGAGPGARSSFPSTSRMAVAHFYLPHTAAAAPVGGFHTGVPFGETATYGFHLS